MTDTVLKFFVRPSSATGELIKISKNQKIALIIGALFVMALSSCFNVLLGLSFSVFDIGVYVATNILFALLIFGVGVLFKVKWKILDVFLFTLLSSVTFSIGYVIGYFLGLTLFMVPAIIGFIWTLVLISKSLSKIGKVSESRITGIFIIAGLIIWAIKSFL